MCKEADRSQFQHYLSKFPYLPSEDCQYLKRSRQVLCPQNNPEDNTLSDPQLEDIPIQHSYRVSATTQRVTIKQSPLVKLFYNHHPLQLTLDTGSEISMIETHVAREIGAAIKKSNKSALQADRVIPPAVVGEVHLNLTWHNTTKHESAT